MMIGKYTIELFVVLEVYWVVKFILTVNPHLISHWEPCLG
jgi:hypothetical protein